MSSGKVLLGVLTGVAVGVLLGILFAPDKGWNTRMMISKKGEDFAEEFREKFDEFVDNIIITSDAVKEEVSDITEGTRTKPSEAGRSAKISA